MVGADLAPAQQVRSSLPLRSVVSYSALPRHASREQLNSVEHIAGTVRPTRASERALRGSRSLPSAHTRQRASGVPEQYPSSQYPSSDRVRVRPVQAAPEHPDQHFAVGGLPAG